ncbi:MAG: hypothetical protein AB9903_02710 [Vulcanimicrobiota bacterium]
MALGEKKPHKRRMLFLIAAAAAVLFFILIVPTFFGAQSSNFFGACKSHLGILGTACEMYSTDNNGYYPQKLELLVENGYLKELPICTKSAEKMWIDKLSFNWRRRFISKPHMTYVVKAYGKEGVLIYCSGKYHKDLIGNKDGPAFGTKSRTVDTLDDAEYK